MNTPPGSLHSNELRDVVAVLEHFDQATLDAMLGRDTRLELDALMQTGEVMRDDAGYHARFGEHPLADAPAREAELHGRVSTYYRGRMQAGEAAAERRYVDHLVRQCDLLLHTAPGMLAEALHDAPLAILSDRRDQHLLRYYQGLGEGLADRLGEARALFAALLSEDDVEPLVRGRALNSGALFAQMQGAHQSALDAYRASRAIWLQLGNQVREANVLHNLGILHYELRDLDDAERYFRDAAAIYAAMDDEPHLAMSWNELGLVLRDGGRWNEAVETLRRASAIFEQHGAQNSLGIVLGNLGEIELARGHYADASVLFERSLELMTSRVYAVDTRINIGLLAQAQGDHQAALAHYQAARALAGELGRREIMALIAYREGHALQYLGRGQEALQSYHAAMQAVEAVRSPLRDEGLLLSLMGRWQLVYEAAFLLSLEQNDAAGAFAIAERARARAFADQLARHDTPDPAPVLPLDAAGTRARLPDGTLLLAYFCTGLRGDDYRILQAMPPEAQGLRACLSVPERLVGMALNNRDMAVFTSPLNPNVLHSAAGRNDGARFLSQSALARLGEALLTPVAALIDAADDLVLVPHGPLHQVPFAALINQDGLALIDRVAELTVSPSATVLLQVLPERHVAGGATCLALGYDGGERALRHTEAEAHTIAALFGTQAWLGRPGMRRRLLGEAEQFRYLHLACHGEFNLDDPLASWLEVGPGERLTATDVLAGMRLDAELVVLSACRSGVSRVLRGDEPIGLARAFLGAGAHAVLVTLWPVEDSASRLVMEYMYRELVSGKRSPARAMREAQRYLRGITLEEARAALGEQPPVDAPQPYADPHFWAAYVIIGSG